MYNNLTGLRGVLVVLVLLDHAGSFAHKLQLSYPSSILFTLGQESVHVFFALSGALIVPGILTHDGKNLCYDVLAFLKRRLNRIYPLYLLSSVLAVMVYFLIPQLHKSGLDNVNIIDWFLYILIWPFNVIENDVGSLLTVQWSVGAEFFFYVFSTILFVNGKNKMYNVLAVLLIFEAVDGFFGVRNFGVRFDIFLLSGIVFHVANSREYIYFIPCLILMIVSPQPFYVLTIAILVLLLSILPEFLSTFKKLGSYSYSFYLFHLFVLHLVFFGFIMIGFNLGAILNSLVINSIAIFILVTCLNNFGQKIESLKLWK